jgi:hypothetical protein
MGDKSKSLKLRFKGNESEFSRSRYRYLHRLLVRQNPSVESGIGKRVTYSLHQCFGSVFILYGSGSSFLGGIPIQIQSVSRVLMTKNWKKIYS